MERMKKGMLLSPAMVLLFLGFAVLVMLPEVSAKRWMVGDGKFWNPNINYTIWARGKHFYNGDWLYFVYDRNQMDVIEVNKTNYENCIGDHPVHNWTTGAGRDVVPLNVTRHYYFITTKGGCYGGMKLAVRVENAPPPPKAAPEKAGAPTLSSRGQILLMPLVFAIGAAWDAFIYSV